MIHIPSLRTARFNVDIREMSLIDSVNLMNKPAHLEHAQTTFALKSMIEQINVIGSNKSLEDVRYWTIQERMFAITNYIAGTQEDNPDFSIEDLKYTDFLQAEKQFKLPYVDLGIIEDEQWKGYPLLGWMAETIENLEGEIEGISNKLHWLVGCIACQLIPDDHVIDPHTENYEKVILDHMKRIANLPESDFGTLYIMLKKTNEELEHIFEIEITDNGILAVSKPIEKEGGAIKQYARFPSSAIVGELARELSNRTV